MDFPTLHTERLDLIEIEDKHMNDLYKLFSDQDVTRFYNLLPFKEPKEGKVFIDWYRTRSKNRQAIRWGIVIKGTANLIGTIGFNNYTTLHRANIGYDLQSEYWNNGYTTEALATVVKFGFVQLGINRIEAEVMPGNDASGRVLEKIQFQKEGILRQWMFWNDKYYDMIMYSLLKSDYKMDEALLSI